MHLAVVRGSLARAYTSRQNVSPYDSSTLPRTGACSTGYLGGEARPTLEACVSSCTGSCAFISYCASTKALCTAAHANKYSFNVSCHRQLVVHHLERINCARLVVHLQCAVEELFVISAAVIRRQDREQGGHLINVQTLSVFCQDP